MKFRSFFWTITVSSIAIFLSGIVSLGWIASQSSLGLLTGGVNYFPAGTAFVGKQAPAMVSLLTNPEQLDALRQVTLPLTKRRSDRAQWQQWEQDLVAKIGFDYRQDFKPWLGDEITFAIANLDSDRNSDNGVQPGYILAAKTKNTRLAQEHLREFYRQHNGKIEPYKGANIISSGKTSSIWSGVVLGDFVLFANRSQILKEAIERALAVDLNLQHSDYYQTALSKITQPHIGIGYVDVLRLSAWLDKSTLLGRADDRQIAVSLSIRGSNLAAQIALIDEKNPSNNSSVNQSFLDNPEFKQILASLPFNQDNLAYIDIKGKKSLLEDKIPLYKITKLAIQSLFPHLKAIAIQDLGKEDNVRRADILFKLDS